MKPVPLTPRVGLLDMLGASPQEATGIRLASYTAAIVDSLNLWRQEAYQRAVGQEAATREVAEAVGRLQEGNAQAAGRMAEQVARLQESISSELEAVGGTLEAIQQEVEHTRRLQEQQLAGQQEGLDLQRRSLALQQAMLQSDHLQSKLEEFLYQFKKAVDRCGSPDSVYPATTRLLIVKGFLGEVERQNIQTPLIRGIDKKTLFDETRDKARRLADELSRHPDVLAALEWARREQQRVKDEEERRRLEQQAEERRRREAEEAWKRELEVLQGEESRLKKEIKEEERRRREAWKRELEVLQGEESRLKKEIKPITSEISKQEAKLVTSFGKWFQGRFGFEFVAIPALTFLLSMFAICAGPAGSYIFYGSPLFSRWLIGGAVPWVFVVVASLVASSLHRKAVVDVKQDQEELDRTVNTEALAEIARLKEKLEPLNEEMKGVRQRIEEHKQNLPVELKEKLEPLNEELKRVCEKIEEHKQNPPEEPKGKGERPGRQGRQDGLPQEQFATDLGGFLSRGQVNEAVELYKTTASDPTRASEFIRAVQEKDRKIEAIKLHRESTGCGLADAKTFVEAIHAVIGVR